MKKKVRIRYGIKDNMLWYKSGEEFIVEDDGDDKLYLSTGIRGKGYGYIFKHHCEVISEDMEYFVKTLNDKNMSYETFKELYDTYNKIIKNK